MRVLIAVDGTEHSVTVVQAAHRLFGDAAEYLVLSVAQVPVGGYAAPFGTISPMAAPMMPADTAALWPGDVEESSEAARVQAEDVVGSTDLTGADVIGEAGDPVMAIVDAAKAHAVDVIVVGHEDRSWFSRVFEGSVSKDIIRETEVPVLVVPSGVKHRHHHGHDHGHDDAPASPLPAPPEVAS